MMSVQNDVRVTVRVDRNLKQSADFLFERLGLNMSVAFNTDFHGKQITPKNQAYKPISTS